METARGYLAFPRWPFTGHPPPVFWIVYNVPQNVLFVKSYVLKGASRNLGELLNPRMEFGA